MSVVCVDQGTSSEQMFYDVQYYLLHHPEQLKRCRRLGQARHRCLRGRAFPVPELAAATIPDVL